jgi:hypothetical protein
MTTRASKQQSSKKAVRSAYMTIRVTDELADDLKAIAASNSRTMAMQIYHVLTKFAADEKKRLGIK